MRLWLDGREEMMDYFFLLKRGMVSNAAKSLEG
jgi:hypothetical protein